MPSTDIVRDMRTIIQNKLLSNVPKKWHKQFQFGLQAYSLQTFQSATGNARRVETNVNTAARKSERLLANQNLANHLGRVFDCLGLVKPSSLVNVDHSDMNGLMALVGALQTRLGRAIPCFVETTYSDRLSARKDASPRKRALRKARAEERQFRSLTGHTIDALQDFADRLGFWPKLVFDRGFGNESIVTHLVAEGATFYIRVKAGRYVEFDGQRQKIQDLTEKDTTVWLYGLSLRVVRSRKDGKSDEPWYILTNDMTSSRTKLVRIYYHRFEIEESFKDLKHVLEFRRTRLNKPNSLKVILWLMFLGIALLYIATKPSKQYQHPNPKKRTSWIRSALEQLHQAYGLLLWGGG
ncbi:transposase [Candidatus Saccharibacteria bacterium]|nr:MAG: transposase [Candidatus Saccharibacteria bacterium]